MLEMENRQNLNRSQRNHVTMLFFLKYKIITRQAENYIAISFIFFKNQYIYICKLIVKVSIELRLPNHRPIFLIYFQSSRITEFTSYKYSLFSHFHFPRGYISLELPPFYKFIAISKSNVYQFREISHFKLLFETVQ